MGRKKISNYNNKTCCFLNCNNSVSQRKVSNGFVINTRAKTKWFTGEDMSGYICTTCYFKKKTKYTNC